MKSKIMNENKQKQAIDKIIAFFQKERDEKIGIIAAQNVLDFILEEIGKDIYNKGIEDCKERLVNIFEEANFDLDELKN